MPVLSEEAVAGLWVKHGGPITEAAMAVAVSTEESGRDTDAVGPLTSYGAHAIGIMQIHPGKEEDKDPDVNMRKAVGKWRARGWQPWSVCGGSPTSAGVPGCPRLAGKANAIARRIGAPRPGARTQPVGFTDTVKKWLDAAGAANITKSPLAGAGDVAGGAVTGIAGGALDGVKAVAGAIQDLFNLWKAVLVKIADPNTWGDALKIFVGLVLLYMGAKRTFQLTK